MVLVFTATLLFSIVGLSTLLFVKNVELRTGRVVLAGVRGRTGEYCMEALRWCEYSLPALLRFAARRSALLLRAAARSAIAQGALAAEHALERTLHALRRTTDARVPGTEASPFLREVAEYKKKLLRTSRRGTIAED